MSQTTKYNFQGDPNKRATARHQDAPKTPEPYITPPPLVRAVNLAIHLGRPLLLEGEAGCGKTKLARAVADELGLPFYPWYVNSSSRARDGLYTFDSLLRLHDVQMRKQSKAAPNQTGRDPSKPTSYRRWEALGNAFAEAVQGTRAVVLIDEIDKADIDFPNDLLTVLDDDFKFKIPETEELIEAPKENKPIVIITSNREKGDLPEPFLRRCLYYFVEFPDEAALKKIVAVHYADPKKEEDELVKAAANRFINVRSDPKLRKRPGTSEFLDWLRALNTFEPKPYQPSRLDSDQTLPYPETLFKLKDDWKPHANP